MTAPSFNAAAIPPSLVFRAIKNGETAALESYLKQGITLEAQDANGNTALTDALIRGRKRYAKMLIEAGANVNAQGKDAEGRPLLTPLMLALSSGFNDIAQLMLDKKADTTLKDKFGNTALAIVKASGNPEGAQLLFARMTPGQVQEQLLWAIREEDLSSVRFLVERMGAKVTQAGPDGLRPDEDMTLWGGGPIADYVSGKAADENAALIRQGVRHGVKAHKPASFGRK